MKVFLIGKVLNIFLRILYLFPIKNNRIICINFNGKGYGESPKYIVEELLKNKNDFEIFWSVNDIKDTSLPKEIKKIKFKSFKFFLVLYTSKIIINDVRFGLFFNKRKNQVYIQTWHGCLPLKKIENNAVGKLSHYYEAIMKHDSRITDVMVSNSDFFDWLCKNAFLYNGPILKVGCPKDDFLINENKLEIKEKVCRKFKIDTDSVLVLYLPTFRNNYDCNPYDINFSELKKIIQEKYNLKCEIVIKLHPLAIDKYKFENEDEVVNANMYSDIQQLLLAGDIIITDYSSVMFDGLIANKTVILYAKDMNNYGKERGYYFEFEELPFHIAKNNTELMRIVKENDLNDMKKNYISFKKKVGLIEKGTASTEVSKYIIDIINGVDNE